MSDEAEAVAAADEAAQHARVLRVLSDVAENGAAGEFEDSTAGDTLAIMLCLLREMPLRGAAGVAESPEYAVSACSSSSTQVLVEARLELEVEAKEEVLRRRLSKVPPQRGRRRLTRDGDGRS